TDPLGNPTLYDYDWFGMVRSETSVAGDTTAFVYDRLGRIQHETFPDNTTRRYFYSADGQLVRAVDNNGTAFDYQYDLAGRLAMEKGPTGQISYRYDNAGNISQIISPNGWITTNTYDAANRLSAVQVGSSVTAYTYNAAGQVVEAKNPNNNTVQFTYDDLGRQTKTVIAPGTLGSTWRTEYDARGRRTAQIDPLWHRISYVYDHLDRLTETRENLLSGVQHAVETTDASLLSQNFTAVGSAQIASDAASPYNGSYRLKVTASAAGAGVKAKVPVLLKKGQTVTASVAASGSGSVTVDLYDEKNQSGSTPVTLTLGSAWTVSTPVSLTVGGSSGSDSDQVYLRVLSTVSGAATVYLDGLEVNQSTRTEYDPFPTGTAVLPASYEQRSVDVLGRTSRITFDLLGRTLSSTDALGNTFAMAYLDTLKRTVRTDALGRQTITQMDSRSRPSFVQYPDGSKVSVTYDGNGNMLTMADSLGLTVYQYDSANRLKRSVDPFGRVMSYEYEGAALKRVTSPVGAVTYNYDPNSGFVTSMVTKNALNQEETTSFQYDPAGNLKQKTTGSHTTTWTYDSGERLTGIEAKYGSSRRYQGTYAYDQAWNRNRYTLYNSYENTTTTFNYTFDPLYRLIKTTESNGNNRTYQYDGAGNRLARTDVKGGVTTQETYSYDAANRLLSMITTKNATSETTSYEYDANGNQTRIISPKGVGTLSYDFENRLVEFVDPVQGRVVNRYNGMGQKLYTMDGTDETYFLLDRGQVMADLDGAGATIAAYFRAPGGQLISTHQRTGTYYYHIDGLGSVVGLTKPDGTWDSLYQYDEFGVVQANKGQAWNNFQYTGATYSPTSGLYHLGARHYNPAIGRFITQDTYAGNPWQPWTKNLYVYVGNNPVNYIDPTGHFLVMITVNTFIPDARFWESAWLGEGDGRDLWESGSSRTTHTVYVDTETGAWFDEKSMHPSETLFWDFPAPSGDSMMATVWQDDDGNTMVAFVANEASEALAWSGATISYAFVITIDKNGDLSLVGVHDGFPAYEIYAYSDDQFAGYGYNPRDHWETLGSLFDWAGGPEKVTTGFNYFPYDESEDCTSEGFCSK
ncbi:MAG TPA: RHS repeat-associated core domain-containing protein, partial [Symbiobacteriaceae bacterium]|nr:RHS repeat-associated core domain-containing protein [Symbiobacteriaceae bacterium]